MGRKLVDSPAHILDRLLEKKQNPPKQLYRGISSDARFFCPIQLEQAERVERDAEPG